MHARLFDGELRAVPIGVALVAVEQHAEFVDAVDDLRFAEDVMLRLHLSGAAEQFVQRQHGVVAGVVGVMAGRAIDRLALGVAHGVVIRDRDRLVVGDEEAELRLRGRRPRAHARVGAGLVEVDRRAAALFMEARVGGRPFLMRAPAEFRRLHALGQKALDRPGVDEDIARLRMFGALRVALGDMHALDAEALREPPHSSRVFGSAAFSPRSAARLTSACLTNQETMPGLAPQQETAVDPPGFLRRSASTVSRSA